MSKFLPQERLDLLVATEPNQQAILVALDLQAFQASCPGKGDIDLPLLEGPAEVHNHAVQCQTLALVNRHRPGGCQGYLCAAQEAKWSLVSELGDGALGEDGPFLSVKELDDRPQLVACSGALDEQVSLLLSYLRTVAEEPDPLVVPRAVLGFRHPRGVVSFEIADESLAPVAKPQLEV